MTVKELFDKAENGTLTWEQFQTAMGDAKFVDLNEGNYVSKQKYTDELSQRDTRITSLNDTLSARDTDLANLQQTLKDAGDVESLKKASQDLADLQKRYDKETRDYQKQLAKQAYEFAVKDFANSKKFTSSAAKRDFTRALLEKNLTLDNDRIIGAEDFVQMYQTENADAFVVENQNNQTPPEPPKPQFVSPTQGSEPAPTEKNPFVEAFHFTGVRPVEQQK